MAKKKNDDLFDVLRGRGLRKRVARTIAELDGSGRKAAATRKRDAAKRSAAAKKGARTRAKAKH